MNRQATISQAVKAHPRTANGGTTAPRGPGRTTAVGSNQQKYNPQQGLAGNKPAPNGPAGNPTTGAPSPYTPPPWDSAYQNSVGGANAKYNNTNIGLDYQRQAADQEFGLAPNFNDYQTNPWSRAALLEKSYRQANRGTTASRAAAGQLYAGSTSNALSANRGQYGQNRDALEKQYRAAVQEIEDHRLAAQNEKGGEIDDAAWKRIETAEGAPLDSSVTPEKQKKQQKKQPQNKRKETIHYSVSSARAVGQPKKKGKK